MTINPILVRQEFPALSRQTIFFDNPGGTQVARHALERMQRYLVETNANHGGYFATSQQSDASIDAARSAMADFLHASRPEEIVFGPNMTSLTFNISRSLGRVFQPGDVIAVTRLDHDANVSPWLLLAEDRGLKIRWVDFHAEDCTLDLDDLQAALNERPKLLAVGYASNAVGTVNPLKKIITLAHQAGALVYVDAVQYAPHGPINVQDLDCDFLVCSAYKFFGPHLGILYGRYNLLDSLPAYRVRPAPSIPPGKFETGTGLFEGYSGLLGALDYLEWVGQYFGEEQYDIYSGQYTGRSLTYKLAMSAIQKYETELSRAFITGLHSVPGLKIFGITNLDRLDERVPTVSFTLAGHSPDAVARRLADEKINVWNGNFYAINATERLGLENTGGLVRVGATHYNTTDEIDRLIKALRKITG